MSNCKERSFKKMNIDDRGSTLITVIVAIAFVTILASIILSTTVMNFRMKNVDYSTRNDFYYAEKALNDVYVGIGQQVATIAGEKYDEAFGKVGTQEGTEYYDTAEKAQKAFKELYLKAVYNEYKGKDIKTKLAKYKVKVSSTRINNDDIVVENADPIIYRHENAETGEITDDSNYGDDVKCLVIKNVRVSAEDKNNYQSTITTDIVISIPTLDFFGTNADVTEYGLIACQGIYINGKATINGSVYAGIHDPSTSSSSQKEIDEKAGAKDLYGGINVTSEEVSVNGNYIVSKGDINITGTNTEFTVANISTGGSNLPNLWFDSLRTVKGASGIKVNINANTYALNDLELNADNATVNVKGNYYGYNDKMQASDGSDLNSISYSSDREDNNSSAIIINGKKNTLDMSDIDTFVLMGKAYVDFTSKGADDTEMISTSGDSEAKVVETAEGVALKTNQQLYLVPTDFLSCPNPATKAEYDAVGGFNFYSDSDTEEFKTEQTEKIKGTNESEGWFGWKFVDQGSGKTINDIFDTYKVGDVYYAYLKFNDKKWFIREDSGVPGTYTYEEDTSGSTVGTGGTVSSKTAFFHSIMTSETRWKYNYNQILNDPKKAAGDTEKSEKLMDQSETQPCAYRLYQRIVNSISYNGNPDESFNLQECVIGDAAHNSINDPDGAVIYARNAVVSYSRPSGSTDSIQTNVMINKVGMERYFGYSQNLLHRYQALCAFLDANENVALDKDPFEGKSAVENEAESYWNADNTTVPMSKFIIMNNLSGKNTSTTEDSDLPVNAYGECVVKDGDYTVKINYGGTSFKGIVLATGNITVPEGINVDGLLVAAGMITIEGGGSTISADKGLLQSRVQKEMSLVEQSKQTKDLAYKDNYLIRYLTSNGSTYMYDVEPNTKSDSDYISVDYNDFMYFENWQKGER